MEKKGFGRACGKRHAVVQLGEGEQKLILQIHNGLRSVVASGLLKGFQPAARMGHIVSTVLHHVRKLSDSIEQKKKSFFCLVF